MKHNYLRTVLFTLLVFFSFLKLNAQLTYVPDDTFEELLINVGADNEMDNYVLTENLQKTTVLNFSNSNLSDLTGIQDFNSLTGLICSNTLLNNVDLSQVKSLEFVSFENNSFLTDLNLSGLTSLVSLYIDNNQLTTLNASGLISLVSLSCKSNNLTSLKLNGLTALEDLNCENNKLTTLDASGLNSLNSLICGSNQLSSVDLNGLSSLETLNCEFNQLTSLNLSGLSSLSWLMCSHNLISNIYFANAINLVFLFCDNNQLRTLDLSGLPYIEEFNCSSNLMTALNFKNGNNYEVDYFSSLENPNLECIQVDDIEFSSSNWVNIDSQTSFSKSSCVISVAVYNVDIQSNVHKLELDDLSIAADGSSATLFKYPSSDTVNIIFKIKEDQNNNPDLYGSFEAGVFVNDSLNVTYNHSKYFPEVNQQNKEVTIEIINSETNEVFDEFPLKIVRPSVLMVHGIWSDGNKAFGDMMKRLKEEEMYLQSQLQYAEYAGDRHNEDNKFDFKSNGIDNLKRTALENNISLGKIDVLAHSNGGLLTRQYIQDNAYENDINKLISLNTPHSGSQLANYLLSDEAFSIYLRGLMAEHRFYTERGVIEDLRVDGNFIKKLNNHSTEQFSVMYESIGVHSIYSTQTVAREVGNIDESIFFWIKYKSIGLSDDFLENDIFNTPNHDLVVPQSSQIGGAENTRLFQNQSHMGTASNIDIQNWIIDLLNQNSNNSDYFSSKGYNPQTLVSNYNAGKKQTSKAIGDETINIIIPIAGTEINAGEIVSIQANGSSGIENIVSSMGNIVVPIQNHITENSTSANFDFAIPNNSLGRLEIVSAGFGANGFEYYDSTYIIVTTDAVLESIEIDQSLIYVPEGSKSTITILGHYGDGEIRNITNIDDLSYAFTQNNAEISESGLVTGLNEGEDVLMVSYLGKSAIVPIKIASSISLSTEEKIITNDEFLIFPNPVEDILIIKFPLNQSKVKVNIYNLLGQLVLNKEITNTKNDMNISSIESGMYILKIETEKGIISKRILKK